MNLQGVQALQRGRDPGNLKLHDLHMLQPECNAPAPNSTSRAAAAFKLGIVDCECEIVYLRSPKAQWIRTGPGSVVLVRRIVGVPDISDGTLRL